MALLGKAYPIAADPWSGRECMQEHMASAPEAPRGRRMGGVGVEEASCERENNNHSKTAFDLNDARTPRNTEETLRAVMVFGNGRGGGAKSRHTASGGEKPVYWGILRLKKELGWFWLALLCFANPSSGPEEERLEKGSVFGVEPFVLRRRRLKWLTRISFPRKQQDVLIDGRGVFC